MTTKRDVRRYVKITTDMPGHQKLADAPPGTKWLAACGIIVSGRDLSNGIIRPAVAVAEAEVPTKHVNDLIRRGIWHKPGHNCPKCEQPPAGRIVVHDYLEHNSSRDAAEAGIAAMSSGGVKGNHTRWHEKEGVVDPTCPLCDSGSGSGTRSGNRSGRGVAPESHITSQNIQLTKSGQSQTDPPTVDDDGLTRIQELTKGSKAHARKCVEFVLSKTSNDIKNPTAYVLKAIREDPDAFKFRRGNPRKGDECPEHAGQWADACAGCAADRKAKS